MRGVHPNHTIKNPDAKSSWDRWEFPTGDHSLQVSSTGQWIGTGCHLNTAPTKAQPAGRRGPFCWTPSKAFSFGGKRFVALYPCMAFETQNFGFVIQRGPDGIIMAST